MNENQNQRQQQYTFLNLKKAIGSKGQTYNAIVLEAFTARISEPRQAEGNTVISISTPISGRNKYITSFFGTEPSATQDGTVFAQVSLWGKLAERYIHFSQKYPKAVLFVTGSARIVESQAKDGRVYKNLVINADDFDVKRIIEATAAPRQEAPTQNQPAPQPEPVHQEQPDAMEGFIPVGYSDADLPF